MGRAGAPTNVVDAGALIAFDRGDARARRYFQRSRENGFRLVIPAAVLAQVWRDAARQVNLASLVRDACTVEPLDEQRAKAAGILCGRSGTADIADASVVLAARIHRGLVVSSDPDDLRRIDPSIEVESL